MKRNNIIVVVVIIIMLILGVVTLKLVSKKSENVIDTTPQISNGEITEKLRLSIKSDENISVYKKGGSILISGIIENLAGQKLFFYTPESSLTATFEIIDPQGDEVKAAYPISDPPLPQQKDFVLIGPGESLPKKFEVVIPEEHLKSSGIYTISVVYKVWQDWYYDYEKNKSITLGAWTGTLKSNAIKIEIQ